MADRHGPAPRPLTAEDLELLRAAFPFPDPATAPGDGPLAFGGDLTPGRLLSAYSQGIFPWYDDSVPILWWSPDPRFVLLPEELRVPRSMRRAARRGRFALTLDHAFDAVVAACAKAPRPGQEGTWITREMAEAYGGLHRLGCAHSVEAWLDGELVGGLYGICLGEVFFGESMFHRVPEAAKVALLRLVEELRRRDVGLVDCQQETEHLARFGARPMPRGEFLERLDEALARPTARGPWVG